MSKKGLLLVVSGPSGVGKDTVVQKLLERNSNMKLSVSATTRPPRKGEEDGVHYFFLDNAAFERKIQRGEMLEYAQYGGNYYGTPKKAVEDWRSKGIDVVLVIEVQGAMKIKQSGLDAHFVFIMPPSFEVLEKRLKGRQTEDEAAVRKRLETARREMALAGHYDEVVVNDDLDQAVEQMEQIVWKLKQKAAV